MFEDGYVSEPGCGEVGFEQSTEGQCPMGSGFLKRLEHGYLRPALRKLRPSRHVRFGGIDISYREELDGGGTSFGQDFLSFFKALGMPRQKRIFEWCSGPGFIGFSLLGNAVGETLCLADINPDAIASCRHTVRANGLGDRVSVYQSDNLKDIPHSEKWDLVVSNPPHFIDQYEGDIRAHDPQWRIHREFLANIGDFLSKGGVIVLQENNRGSTVETFRQMIEQSALKIVFTHGDSPTLTAESAFYYIGIMRREEEPPAWACSHVERVFDSSRNDSVWRRVAPASATPKSD
jgi:SAM-dependent methyltransferase